MAKRLFLCLVLVSLFITAKGQLMDDTRHVDTLTWQQRIALRTNIVEWAAVIPNIGAEFDIFKTNYNRWTAGINLRWRPRTSSTYVYPLHYSIFEIALEGREYWRERKTEKAGYLAPHTSYLDKAFSCRNANPSHPKWIFYRGGFLAYGQYSVVIGENHWGRQGDYAMAGVSWGFIKPFQTFRNGSSLDWEFGISAGFGMTRSQRIKADQYNNCYITDDAGMSKWHFMKYPMLRDIRVGLVYRPGNYAIQKRNRWRYDVDLAYHDRIDSMYASREAAFYQKQTADSIYKLVSTRYKQIYDSLYTIQNKIDVAERIAKNIEIAKKDSLKKDSILQKKQAVADAKQAARDSVMEVNKAKARAKVAARDSAIAANKAIAQAKQKAKQAARDSVMEVNKAAARAKVAARDSAVAANKAIAKAKADAKQAARDSVMAKNKAEAKAKLDAKAAAEAEKNAAKAKADAEKDAAKAAADAEKNAAKAKANEDKAAAKKEKEETSSKSDSEEKAKDEEAVAEPEKKQKVKLTAKEKFEQKVAEVKARQRKMAQEEAAKKAAKEAEKKAQEEEKGGTE